MGLKVAIIGCSPSADGAPWGDQTWTKWGVRQDDRYWHRFDTVFEIHRKELLSESQQVKMQSRLEVVDVPIYMRENYGFSNGLIYPYEAIFDAFGRYLTSSVAYMLALAILNDAEEIGIWGVDMNEDEYGHQRPNFEYLIGFAKGRGIKVTIPETCPLLKADLYGY